MYYLYKLSSKTTKHYYIGVTFDPKRRERQHFRVIEELVHVILYPTREATCKSKLIHRILAAQVAPKVKKYVWPSKVMKWHYSFAIIGMSRTAKGISKKEDKLLSSGDKWLTNHMKVSTYRYELSPAQKRAKKFIKKIKEEKRKFNQSRYTHTTN